jgi:beta-lactamase superfamily II metal-dependent hydrolase
MNYAKEREVAKQKHRKVKIIILSVVAVLIAVLTVLSCFIPTGTWKYRVSLPKVGVRADGELRMHFLDVGQGDATIIELPDGKSMLIDGGDDTEKTKVALLRYLNALDIDVIDYLVLTHADADHCGSLAAVVEHKEIGRAFLPLVSIDVNDSFAKLYAEIMKEGCGFEYVANGVSFSTNEYTFKAIHPFRFDLDSAIEAGETWDESANAHSAVFWLEYEGVGTLLTSEISQDTEELLLDSSALGLFEDVDLSVMKILKVSHHGSNGSTSERLLTETQVETAIISCGENGYGHPTQAVLERLAAADVAVYRTDVNGSVIVSVNAGESAYQVETLGKE